MSAPGTYRLTLFDVDGAPIDASVDGAGAVVEATLSSDPAHPRPWLDTPKDSSASSVDFVKGSARTGQVNVRIQDKRLNPDDQQARWFTQLLAQHEGLNGLRARLEYTPDGITYQAVIDGPFSAPSLEGNFVDVTASVMDEADGPRKVRAFDRTGTATLVPPGVLGGYGLRLDSPTRDPADPAAKFMLPPAKPMLARVYREAGWQPDNFDFDFFQNWKKESGRASYPPVELVYTDKHEAVDQWVWGPESVASYPNLRFMWRPEGSSAPFTVIDPGDMALAPPVRGYPWHAFNYIPTKLRDGTEVRGILGVACGDGNPAHPKPATNQVVECVVVYIGSASEAWPLHYEGTAGGFLVKALRGDYCAAPVRTRIDEAGILARFPAYMRGRITEATDDLRGWLEQQWCQPQGAALTLDASGAISPVRSVLPDAAAVLPVLTDAVCEPLAEWKHPDSRVVNRVEFEYQRDMLLDPAADPAGESDAGDRIISRSVKVETRLLGPAPGVQHESIRRFGDKPVKISTQLFRSLGGVDGLPLVGEFQDEIGHQVGAYHGAQLTDRFVFGAQEYGAVVDRAAVPGLRQGDWVVMQVSWLPDYVSEARGMNRLAQVVGIDPVNPKRYKLALLDGGDAVQPLAPPAAASSVAQAGGIATVAYTFAAVAGLALAVEFAVTPAGTSAAPAAAVGVWRPLGRLSATGSLSTPLLPAGVKVWFRARREGVRRRPSLFTVGGSVTMAAAPRMLSTGMRIGSDGAVRILALGNDYVAGVRIYVAYSLHGTTAPALAPVLDVSAAAAAAGVVLPTRALPGQEVAAAAEPWTGWTGAAVSGAAGVRDPATEIMEADDTTFRLFNFRPIGADAAGAKAAGVPGAGVRRILRFERVLQAPFDDAAAWPVDEQFLVGIEAATPGVEMLFSAAYPPVGSVRLVQLQPHAPDHAAGPVQRWVIQGMDVPPFVRPVFTEHPDGTADMLADVDDERGVLAGIDLYVTGVDGAEAGPLAAGQDSPTAWSYAGIALDPKHNVVVRVVARRSDGGADVAVGTYTLDVGDEANVSATVSDDGAGVATVTCTADTDTATGAAAGEYRVGGGAVSTFAISAAYVGSFTVPQSQGTQVKVEVRGRNAAGTAGPWFPVYLRVYVPAQPARPTIATFGAKKSANGSCGLAQCMAMRLDAVLNDWQAGYGLDVFMDTGDGDPVQVNTNLQPSDFPTSTGYTRKVADTVFSLSGTMVPYTFILRVRNPLGAYTDEKAAAAVQLPVAACPGCS